MPGRTALHYTSHHGHPSASKTLLDHGAVVESLGPFSHHAGKLLNFASDVSKENRKDCTLLLESAMKAQKRRGGGGVDGKR